MTTATMPTSRPSMIAAPARRHQPAGSPGGPGVELTGGRHSSVVSTDGATGGCQSAIGAPKASVSSSGCQRTAESVGLVGHADSVRRDAPNDVRKDARRWEHSETRRLRTGGDMAAQPGRTGESDVLERPIDWERAERSPEFRELVSAKRRFVIPATIFFMAWYLGFVAPGGVRAGLHGRVRVPGPDRGLLPRVVAVRHGPRAGGLVPAQGRERVRPARREGGEARSGDRGGRQRSRPVLDGADDVAASTEEERKA